jgi:hypothetical protein
MMVGELMPETINISSMPTDHHSRYGLFPCPGVSVSIWVNKDAEGRDKFPTNFDSDIYGEQ